MARRDLAAVFMCGLPFSLAQPRPVLIAAPVPSPAAFGGEACYWSEFVVREDSSFATAADTFGRRLALTVPGSQSGCVAALSYFQALSTALEVAPEPLFREVVAPTVTPLGALRSVIRGEAEIAPIDSFAFSLMRRHRPDLAARVRVVARTTSTPIPVLVASPPAGDRAALTRAFLDAHESPATRQFMEPLLLERFVHPDPALYDALRDRAQETMLYWRSRPLATVMHPAFAG